MKYNTNLFSQTLKIVAREKLDNFAFLNGISSHNKGFTPWDHFVSMLFCQFSGTKSLREIVNGLKSCTGKLNHLGMNLAPSKSNLAYSNKERSYRLFEDVFYNLLEQCRQLKPGRKKKFHFKHKLYSMDASIIDLCISIFDWAHYRETKGAIKLHLILDHDGYLPCFAHITTGKVHEVTVAQTMRFQPGSIIVMDRGYTDYELFYRWTQEKVYFVTRTKSNVQYQVHVDRAFPSGKNIISDQEILFTTPASKKKCPAVMRRVAVWDPEKEREIVLLTNNLKLAASTISEIYKDRWEIESFFKTIKQNLKIKTFVGTSANAVKIQVWTALISILLIKYLRFVSRSGLSLSNLVSLLKLNLFTYKDLWLWIDDPFEKSNSPPDIQQEINFRTARNSELTK